MPGAIERKIDGSLGPRESPSTLWCTQLSHHSQFHPQQNAGILAVMDNFYSKYALARQLMSFSDREIKILETLRLNNFVDINSRIVLKYRSIVIFYAKDLAKTLVQPIHGPDKHSLVYGHGLRQLDRWFGDEAVCKTKVQVPAVIFSYNLVINSVDMFDQTCSAASTIGRERQVAKRILTFVLDSSIINMHAFLNAISTSYQPVVNIIEIKQRIVSQLVHRYLSYWLQNQTRWPVLTNIETIDVNYESKPHPFAGEVTLQKQELCAL